MRYFKYHILPFDPKTEGCWTGKIPDTFWRRPGVIRGTHPTHSVAALGPKAREIADGRWEAVLKLDGSILLLGVGTGPISALHIADRRLVQLPPHIVKMIKPPEELQRRLDAENLICGFGPYPEMSLMEDVCRAAGILKETEIGRAKVKLLRLREAVELYAAELRRDPDRFFHS